MTGADDADPIRQHSKQGLKFHSMRHHDYLDPRQADPQMNFPRRPSFDQQSFAEAPSVEHTCGSQHFCAVNAPRRHRRISQSEDRWFENQQQHQHHQQQQHRRGSPGPGPSYEHSQRNDYAPSFASQGRQQQYWHGPASESQRQYGAPMHGTPREMHSPIYSPMPPQHPPPPMRDITVSLPPSIHPQQMTSHYPTPGPPVEPPSIMHPSMSPMMMAGPPPGEGLGGPNVNYPNALPTCRFQNDMVPAPGMYGHPRYPTFVKPGETEPRRAVVLS